MSSKEFETAQDQFDHEDYKTETILDTLRKIQHYIERCERAERELSMQINALNHTIMSELPADEKIFFKIRAATDSCATLEARIMLKTISEALDDLNEG